VDAWRACRGARTLAAHAEALSRARLALESASVARLLEGLVVGGLLVNVPLPDEAPVDAAAITTVGVVTADRPDLLRRCLPTMLNHFAASSRKPRLLVIDGSGSRDARTLTRRYTEEILSSKGWPGCYVGRHIHARLLRRLTADPDISRTSLPGEIGASRNLLLLLTAGEALLMVDDDILALPYSSSCVTTAVDTIRLGGHSEYRIHVPFTDRNAVRNTLQQVPHCLLDLHERLLGRPLSTILQMAACDARDCCNHVLQACNDSNSTVRLTFAGLAGDSAIWCPYRLLFVSGPTRLRLLADPRAFELALASRETVRMVDRYTVSHEPTCMAYCMGLDNRHLLPPFMPFGRNEDGLFGHTLAAQDPGALFGHVPVAVFHDSLRPSAYPQGVVMSAGSRSLSEGFAFALRVCQGAIRSIDPSTRLCRLGELLLDIASLPPHRLLRWVRETIIEYRCNEIAALMKERESGLIPDHWRSASETYQTAFMAALSSSPRVPLADLSYSTENQLAQLVQTRFRLAGRLMIEWPRLWSRAQEAKADIAAME
jgi:hypothetical protein